MTAEDEKKIDVRKIRDLRALVSAFDELPSEADANEWDGAS
jgi:hypothetical protein